MNKYDICEAVKSEETRCVKKNELILLYFILLLPVLVYCFCTRRYPLFTAVHKICFEGVPPQDLLKLLAKL